ncbi:EAL domain-containing protein [Candidatus Ichthyocystis sparus]|nr:EAL domain-containing protein [Candidatus Ichthyocystis sparus]
MIGCSILFFVITIFLFSSLIYSASEGAQNEIRKNSKESLLILQNTLGEILRSNDKDKIADITNALLETGLYRDITIFDHDGNIIISQHTNVRPTGIPKWFINSLRQSPEKNNLTSNKHTQLTVNGYDIDVLAYPLFAYRYLWYLFISCIISLCIACIFCFIILRVMIYKLLKPLSDLYLNIDKIGTKQFTKINELVKTTELKKIIISVNNLSNRLSKITAAEVMLARYFQRQIYMDKVTNLYNKSGMKEEVEKLLCNSSTNKNDWYMLLVSMINLEELNREYGIKKTDEMIVSVSSIIKDCCLDKEQYLQGRPLNTIIAVVVNDKNAKYIAVEIQKKLLDMLENGTDTVVPRIAIAIFSWEHHISFSIFIEQSTHKFLKKITEEEKIQSCEIIYYIQPPNSGTQTPNSVSASELDSIISNELIYLESQPIVRADINKKTVTGYEIFCRSTLGDRTLFPSELLSIADENNRLFDLDHMIVEKSIGVIERLWKKSVCKDIYFHINLSKAVLESTDNMMRIISLLKSKTECCSIIFFEFTENMFVRKKEEILEFTNNLRKNNILNKIGLDRVHLSADFFSIISDIPISHMKISGYTIQQTADKHAQDLMISIIKIANSLNIKVIADNIDTEEKLDIVKSCGINIIQGTLVSGIEKKFNKNFLMH